MAENKNGSTHSPAAMHALYKKAYTFTGTGTPNIMMACYHLYRDKTKQYFDEIINRYNGWMIRYVKPYHGDPKCPASGKLNGLFFNTFLDKKTGCIPPTSIYGDTRMLVPIEVLLNLALNMYFIDFYCIREAHTVVLALCTENTSEDLFCKGTFPKINFYNNPFFVVTIKPRYCVHRGHWFQRSFWVSSKVQVHLLLTRSLNLHFTPSLWQRVIPASKIRKIPRPKNKSCSICNV